MTPAAATGSMNLRPIRLCGSHEGRAQAHRRQVSRWSPRPIRSSRRTPKGWRRRRGGPSPFLATSARALERTFPRLRVGPSGRVELACGTVQGCTSEKPDQWRCAGRCTRVGNRNVARLGYGAGGGDSPKRRFYGGRSLRLVGHRPSFGTGTSAASFATTPPRLANTAAARACAVVDGVRHCASWRRSHRSAPVPAPRLAAVKCSPQSAHVLSRGPVLRASL
jgi:hypothetical protein